MARVSENDLTIGLRGKVGQLMVFRVIRGKTYVRHASRKPDKRKETEAQRKTRTTFKEASCMAKTAVSDPETKQYFVARAKEWNLTNAYTAAVKYFMRTRYASREPRVTSCEPRVTSCEPGMPAASLELRAASLGMPDTSSCKP